jgi:hypothetical protein
MPLTQLLCAAGPFSSCLEQHQERPFQRLFMQDLVIYLTAPVPLLVERRAARSREIDIARTADLEAMQLFLDQWIGTVPRDALIRIDSGGDPGFARSLPLLLERIRGL